MGMIEAVIFTLVIAAIAAIGFGVNHAKLTKVETKLNALHVSFLEILSEEGITLDTIATNVTAHTPLLETLEDKAKNVVSSVEASKFVQDLEASLAKGEALIKNLVGVVSPPAPPSTVERAFGQPITDFKPGDPPSA